MLLDFVPSSANSVLEQALRLVQLVGIPVMAFLLGVGLIILLTSGKNPRRKRMGYVMSLGFSIGIFVASYIPLLAYRIFGEEPRQATGDESIHGLVNETAGFGEYLFTGLFYGAIPLVFTMFYVGLIIMLTAAKSPQKKRLGLGIMIFSPLVMGLIYVLPSLLPML